MNNNDAYNKFREFTNEIPQNVKLGKKCDIAATHFLQQHPDFTTIDHRVLSLKFKRMVESRPGNKTSDVAAQTWECADLECAT